MKEERKTGGILTAWKRMCKLDVVPEGFVPNEAEQKVLELNPTAYIRAIAMDKDGNKVDHISKAAVMWVKIYRAGEVISEGKHV